MNVRPSFDIPTPSEHGGAIVATSTNELRDLPADAPIARSPDGAAFPLHAASLEWGERVIIVEGCGARTAAVVVRGNARIAFEGGLH